MTGIAAFVLCLLLAKLSEPLRLRRNPSTAKRHFSFPSLYSKVTLRPPAEAANAAAYSAASPFIVCVQCKDGLVLFVFPFRKPSVTEGRSSVREVSLANWSLLPTINLSLWTFQEVRWVILNKWSRFRKGHNLYSMNKLFKVCGVPQRSSLELFELSTKV